MDLEFQRESFQFLEKITQEVKYQEETAETIVPDSYPDIGEIIDCFAVPVLRSKESRDRTILVAGGIKAAILYKPEDMTDPKKLELYLPYSIRFEHEAITPETQAIADIKIRSLDARMINSRKAMIRTDIGCEVTAFAQKNWENTSPRNAPPSLQLRKNTYPLYMPVEIGEKDFVISETMDIAENRPSILEVCQMDFRTQVRERKLIANKAVFKGDLECSCLLLRENNELYTHHQTFPFSQYCELEHEYEDENLSVYPVITGYDLDDGLLNIHILSQCIVLGKKTVEVIEDAYCTKNNLIESWKSTDIQTILDQEETGIPIRLPVSGLFKQILLVSLYFGFPTTEINSDSTEITVPVYARILGYDESGSLHAYTSRTEGTHSIVVSPNTLCKTTAVLLSPIHISGNEVRCDLSLKTTCYAPICLRTMDSASIESREEGRGDPSVIMCKPSEDASLWDIAKRFRSTRESIQEANALDSDDFSPNNFLLIPIP